MTVDCRLCVSNGKTVVCKQEEKNEFFIIFNFNALYHNIGKMKERAINKSSDYREFRKLLTMQKTMKFYYENRNFIFALYYS